MNPTPLRSRRPGSLARSGLDLAMVLVVSLTAGCSDSDDPSPAETSSAAPEGPFSVDFAGPETAEPGDVVTATATNTGRLPDVYQLSMVPAGAVSFSKQDFSLSPGESVDIKVTVNEVPVSIVLKSSGGGVGEEVGELDISAP